MHVGCEPVLGLDRFEDLHGRLRPVAVGLELFCEVRLNTKQFFDVSVSLDTSRPVVAHDDVWRTIWVKIKKSQAHTLFPNSYSSLLTRKKR